MVQFLNISLSVVCIFDSLVASVRETYEQKKDTCALAALLLTWSSTVAIGFDIESAHVIDEPYISRKNWGRRWCVLRLSITHEVMSLSEKSISRRG